MDLSNVAKRYLRGLGHHLDAVVNVGKEGVDPGVVKATRSALQTHELIKVKLNQNLEGEREDAIAALAEGTEAAVVHTIGRVALLYKPRKDKPKILLPTSTKKLKRLQNKPKPV